MCNIDSNWTLENIQSSQGCTGYNLVCLFSKQYVHYIPYAGWLGANIYMNSINEEIWKEWNGCGFKLFHQ